MLVRVTDAAARSFYELEAVREGWSTRALERQIGSFLFERLAKSRDKERVLELAKKGQHAERPEDILKDPYVLESVGRTAGGGVAAAGGGVSSVT